MRARLAVVLFGVVLLGASCKVEGAGGRAGEARPPKDGPAAGENQAAAGDSLEAQARPVPLGRSFRFSENAAPEVLPSQAPLSLTASDGTGLTLVGLEARAVVEAPLAFTELHLTFENPEPRVIEGRFQITLPDGASISRFAMKIGDRWQEGEVVELQAARRAYEDFLHRKQDPALLEQAAGNEFTARVFPIPANGRKELVLSYSHELPSFQSSYRLPLRGLPKVGRVDVRVLAPVDGELREVQKLATSDWTPDEDVDVKVPGVEGRLGLRHENLVLARLTPVMDAAPDEIASLLVLFDTSASRALGFEAQVGLLRRLVQGLADGAGEKTPLSVACFDQDVEMVYEGTAGGFDAAAIDRIEERRALGASDLAGALNWIGEYGRKEKKRWARVLLVSDGVATAGESEGDALRAAAKGLRVAEVERLDALMVGGLRDEALLSALVTAGLPRDGAVIDGDKGVAEIARRLTAATRSGIEVAVDGAAWVWPARLDGVQAGDEVLVYADLPKEKNFRISLSGVQLAADRVHLDAAERPLLERAWVKARLSRLLEQRDTVAAGDEDMREAIKKQVVELSTRHRVLSPYTALLVLETEADYARFAIDRNALTDILTVSDSGLEVMQRTGVSIDLPNQPVRPPPAKRALAAKEANGDAEGGRAFDAPTTQGASGERPALQEKAEEEKSMEAPSRSRARAGRAAPPMDAPSAAPPMEAASPEPSMDASASAPAIGRAFDDRDESDAPGIAMREVAPDPAQPPPPRAADRLRTERRRPQLRPGTPAPRPGIPPPSPQEQIVPELRPAKQKAAGAYEGRFGAVMARLEQQDHAGARQLALGWREESPGDVMALVALGEVFEAQGLRPAAARAYGSLIDLFPGRADLRRFAGERLERIEAATLAADTYAKARAQRPDHPASHRLHAFALVKAGRHEEAFRALEEGLKQRYPQGRFAGAVRILQEDLGLVAAAWSAAAPDRADEILARLQAAGGRREQGPSLRFVLNWETDANDVDFHIYDSRGGHAYYSSMQLPSGGDLYADVTTGYGPECFTIRGDLARMAFPYRLQAHYYSRGPMGYGMGKLQIVQHDGRGGLEFEERPFVVMKDGAYVDLGVVKGPL